MTIEHQCESLTGEELPGALRAEFAGRCRSDARWLRLLHETGRARAGRRGRLDALDEFSGDEVAAALGWSRSMAARQLTLADDLVGRLSPVLAAMESGALEVRVRLSTALGLDELPGELAARGPLLAHIARSMVAERAAGEWRLVLTDDDGRLERVILLASRPGPCSRPPPGRRRAGSRRRGRARDDIEGRAVVELQVPTAMVAGLDPGAHPE